MANPTPGPWTIKGPHPTTNSIDISAPGDGGSFISLYAAWEECMDWLPVEEMMANARLIAAAPDLLALLQRCLPYIKTISRSDNPGYEDDPPPLYEEMKRVIEATNA